MAKNTQTYRVVREWTTVVQSVSYVEASSVEEACELGLDDDDFNDQETVDGGDGPTYVARVEDARGDELVIPERFRNDPNGECE